MMNLAHSVSEEVAGNRQRLKEDYDAFKARGLKLDLTRGKPSAAQLSLSAELLAQPGVNDYVAEGNVDTRNYGGLQGLIEVRRLFATMLEVPAEQIIAAKNSSLTLMHDTLVFALLKGTSDSAKPWSQQGEIAF